MKYDIGTLIRYTHGKEVAIGIITRTNAVTKEYIIHWTEYPEKWPSHVSRMSSTYLDYEPTLGGFTILKAVNK